MLEKGARERRNQRPLAFIVVIAVGATAAWSTTFFAKSAADSFIGVALPRRLLPRVSVATDYRTCTGAPVPGADVGPVSCTRGPADVPIRKQAADIASRTRGRAEPARRHARALIDLTYAFSQGDALDSTILTLEDLSREVNSPAGALSDLSAAYLTRAINRESTRDLLAAVDAADRALRGGRNAAALFNLGIGLQLLGLPIEAARVWERYIAQDRGSPWAREAAAWKSRLRIPTTPSPCEAESPSAIRRAASLHPQGARECAMDILVEEWANTILAGRAAEVASLTSSLDALVAGLATVGGDRTLEKVLVAVREAGDDGRRRALATEFRRTAMANRAFSRARYTDAANQYDEVLRASQLPPVLRLWAASGRAASAVNLGETGRRDSLLAELRHTSDSVVFPAFFARTHWTLGTIALREGRFEDALELYETARRHYRRVHEDANAAALTYLMAETQLRLGDVETGLATMRAALRDLQRHRPSVWLHNALYVLARAADGEGFDAAAARIAAEDASVTSGLDSARYGRELYMLEARLGQARIAKTSQDRDQALNEVPRLLGRIVDTATRATMQQRYHALRFSASTRLTAAAAARLDSAIEYFRSRNVVLLLPALLGRAEMRVTQGQLAAGAQDLDEAVALLDRQQAWITGEWHRASLLASAKGTYERLVMLHVQGRRFDTALHYLERGRRSSRRDQGSRGLTIRMRRGALAITHAMIGDTLLVWTVDSVGPSFLSHRVSRAHVFELLSRVRRSFEHSGDESATTRDLEALFDLLLRPIVHRIGAAATLVFAEDGPLAGVPFAALRDGVRGRYLVEDHVVVLANSVRDGVESYAGTLSANPRPTRDWRAFVVGEPAIDSGRWPQLDDLPNARLEAERVAALYPRRELVVGEAAHAAAVERGFRHASLVHYAGHAVVDERQPGASSLVLTPEGKTSGSDRLTAETLERLTLDHVRLVVLAACESVWTDAGGVSYRAFADALRRAGVGGVVGSLWKVNDRSTSDFMVAFHEALIDTADPATALALVQRRMLSDESGGRASPVVWGPFQYIGEWRYRSADSITTHPGRR